MLLSCKRSSIKNIKNAFTMLKPKCSNYSTKKKKRKTLNKYEVNQLEAKK